MFLYCISVRYELGTSTVPNRHRLGGIGFSTGRYNPFESALKCMGVCLEIGIFNTKTRSWYKNQQVRQCHLIRYWYVTSASHHIPTDKLITQTLLLHNTLLGLTFIFIFLLFFFSFHFIYQVFGFVYLRFSHSPRTSVVSI